METTHREGDGDLGDGQAAVTSSDHGSTEPHVLAASALYAYSAALLAASAALLVWGPLHGVDALRVLVPEPVMFVVICLLWTAALWAPVPLHHRGNTSLVVLEEVPILLGLVFLTPTLLVLSSVCSGVLMFFVLSRQAVVKATFNLALGALSTTIAALVYRATLDHHSPVSLWGWAVAALSLVACAVTTNLTILVWARLHGQTTERRTGPQIAVNAMITAASVCLAFVVLDAAWVALWATLPVLVVAALVILVYRAYTRLSLRFASLQRLYDFSRALGTANLEPSSLSVEVLDQVCTVMRARRAEIIFAEPTGIPRRISMNEHRASGLTPIRLEASSIVAQALKSGQAALHPVDKVEQRGSSWDPILGNYSAAVVAPIMTENAPIGVIVALDRDEELDGFDEDDLLLFETLVAHASANLERARLVEELQFEVDSKTYQATHDMLTGLPNRMLFVTRAQDALNESPGIAVVLLDIDRFKDVNDTLGHGIGDRLLIEVAERLQHAVSEQTTVARLGGDEFALVISDVSEATQAVAIVNDLHTILSRPIDIDGLTLAVTASAGVALAPAHGDDVALLLQRADIAMYIAKERRTTVELYSVEHDQSMQRWLMLGGLLTHAIDTRTGLSVKYQAQADVRTRRIVQVEALARLEPPGTRRDPARRVHRHRRTDGSG